MLQRTQNADRIQIVVVADVRDAENLAFHFTLAISDNGIERVAEFLNEFSGINSVRGANCGEGGCGRGCVKLQSNGLRAGASHGGTELRIFDENFPSLGQVTISHSPHKIQRSSQRRK